MKQSNTFKLRLSDMNIKYILYTFVFTACFFHIGSAQEIKYNVSVNTPTLQMADPAVFKSFEKSVNEFLNNQRWTDLEVKEEEKVNVNVQFNLVKEFSERDFLFSISILATRPVYGTSYESVIFQYVDEKVAFTYEPGFAFIFNSNSYNDALSSVMGYYSYIILGLDKDSFADHSGSEMYSLAQTIMTSLPNNIANGDEFGWSVSKVGLNKVRSSFIENLLSPKLNDFRTGFYEYHRQGLDLSSTDIVNARKNMINAMKQIESSYDSYVNSLVVNLMGNIKGKELVEIFKPADKAEKQEIYKILTKIDPAGLQNYVDLR
ncbi:MAG: DUF4835 family protein [Saprospiraceae bacterium]|uniref:type IX secretion system protein PorD n=1 Tax=Candidatus Brachybacter algidus TaxID=2982024 RepID=UPI00257A54D5|nr:DUF4835 family protein [Candidatus Brachybacter algidus]MBK7602379.1 DUF4835 family protein [Candidatus Brachybacter algidus]